MAIEESGEHSNPSDVKDVESEGDEGTSSRTPR